MFRNYKSVLGKMEQCFCVLRNNLCDRSVPEIDRAQFHLRWDRILTATMLNAKRGRQLRNSSVRTEGILLLISALIALSLSCRSEAPVETTADPAQSELRTAIAGLFTIDELKVEFARLAIRVAQTGCADTDARLAGEPTRVLISLTDSARVGFGFISSKTQLKMGPGGSGSVPVLVVAVEGPGERTSGEQSPVDRTFIFVEPVADPDFTTCTIEDAPLALEITDRLYGSFEFEPIEFP